MTKVTLHYELSRPLSDSDLESISRVHSVYGIVRVQVAPALDKITVDYDASRLMKQDVEAVLARHDIPIRAAAPVSAVG
jgi:copper chaperone CopZ